MDETKIVQLASELLWLVLVLSLPIVLVVSLVGILIGLAQALTQIQDQTIAFVIKLVCACITLALTHHWMGEALLGYLAKTMDLIGQMGS
ncbi:type III secretion system export apparatus subunit SctS [Salmonella enterica]|nr:EscS/YscS/HrcS family type III secretion system export apparatus protein [Salmonella enterica subsp. enterica serovar Sandiego]EEC0251376.1 EscS/YscS/HrcS family type III secretion system export apparatus protein [Salmonella enterica subsp. enterica]EJW2128688.1 type III secretion system export apparatus subunit SctS [Salmonella enterica]EEE4266738.1 EscS/YscS/HrcS family type III secretion system export apparatus protein [Salmonella enterica subsp. enterica serovar Sandiego]EKT1704580.1 typ